MPVKRPTYPLTVRIAIAKALLTAGMFACCCMLYDANVLDACPGANAKDTMACFAGMFLHEPHCLDDQHVKVSNPGLQLNFSSDQSRSELHCTCAGYQPCSFDPVTLMRR